MTSPWKRSLVADEGVCLSPDVFSCSYRASLLSFLTCFALLSGSGVTYRGDWQGTEVAVKIVMISHDAISILKEFAAEVFLFLPSFLPTILSTAFAFFVGTQISFPLTHNPDPINPNPNSLFVGRFPFYRSCVTQTSSIFWALRLEKSKLRSWQRWCTTGTSSRSFIWPLSMRRRRTKNSSRRCSKFPPRRSKFWRFAPPPPPTLPTHSHTPL